MIRRGVGLSLALIASSAAAAQAQGLVIDHKAVGCIVVGKYPKMDACFTPAADLARSRVYFRPEGVTSWYYVDMKSDQPCFTGTLPRPGKKLIGKKIEYYVEAQNKKFEPARSAEFAPIVVKSAQECKKDVPVAPFLNNATVAVFPAVPAGFVGGGIGTAAVVGIVGAGAAAAGTAAVVASNNNDTTTTTVPVVVTPPTVTTTLPATTPTTTLAPKAGNKAPFAVMTTNPDPPSGQGPLTVTFDLCKSTDPENDKLSYLLQLRGRLEDLWLLYRVPHVSVHVPGRGRRAPSGSVVRGGRLCRGHERERRLPDAHSQRHEPAAEVQHGPALDHDHAAVGGWVCRLFSRDGLRGCAQRDLGALPGLSWTPAVPRPPTPARP